MMNAKILSAAAIAITALATPAMAQSVADGPARCQSVMPNANCAPGASTASRDVRYRQRQAAYRDITYRRNGDNSWNRRDDGFFPLNAAGAVAGAAVGTAAAVTGAAVGTAAAVASAPFRGWDNSYAYDNRYAYGDRGWTGDWGTYAARNGIVCRPGTWFKGADGLQHICQ